MKKKIRLVLSIVLIFSTIFMGSGFGKNVSAAENTATKQSTDIKPIHQYTFDKDNADTIVDTGSMAGTDGKFNGKASGTQVIKEDGISYRKFNGSSDDAKFSNNILPKGNKTIKFDIRKTNFKDAGVGNWETIMATTRDNAGRGINIGIYGGELYVRLNINDEIKTQCKANIKDVFKDNKFHTVMITLDYTNENISVYIDDLVTSKTTAKIFEHAGDYHDWELVIGHHLFPGYSYYLQADIAKFEIYDRILDYSIKAESITLDKSSISLLKGKKETDKLTATVKPDNATNKKVIWSSSDESIAKVDQNGNITAGKVGHATITATVEGTDLKATCEVNVTEDKSRAILAITMVNGITKEYDVSADEISAFEKWFDESNGKGQVRYGFNKKINPYKQVKEYIVFDKIASFEIRSYEADK